MSLSRVRDDASEDNKTSELCMEELKNCEQQSAGVFYVLISTVKYGFRPSPRRISHNEMEGVGRLHDANVTTVIEYWQLKLEAEELGRAP